MGVNDIESRQALDERLARAARAVASLEERVAGSVGKVAHAIGMACQALEESARFSKGDVYLIHVLQSAVSKIANAVEALGVPYDSHEKIDAGAERLREATSKVMEHTYGTIGSACYALVMAYGAMQSAIAAEGISKSVSFIVPTMELANAAETLARLVPGGALSSNDQGFPDIVKERMSGNSDRVVIVGEIEKEQIDEDEFRYKSIVYLNGYPITYFSMKPGDKAWALKDETAIVLGLEKSMHYRLLHEGRKRIKAILESADSDLINLCVDANRGFTP